MPARARSSIPNTCPIPRATGTRLCLDISIVALIDARERIGEHGLFVVADVANLPFAPEVIDGLVSLHTLHHLTAEDYLPAYHELRRVMKGGARAVVINGWGDSSLMRFFRYPMLFMERLTKKNAASKSAEAHEQTTEPKAEAKSKPEGTFVHKLDADGLRKLLGKDFPVEIRVWRSVSVRFLRAMIQPYLLGRFWLALLYGLEELFPRFFGEKGQYPMITFTKN